MDFLLETRPTPIGTLLIATDTEGRLRVVDWTDYEPRMLALLRLHYGAGNVQLQLRRGAPSAAATALQAYFEGELRAIEGLALATGGTPFQREVWAALLRIPCGQTRSYGEIATAIGRPKAVRAVGLANGSNPISIVVPCHRVIGANATMTGYGGGLPRKRWLLEHEGWAPPAARNGELFTSSRPAAC